MYVTTGKVEGRDDGLSKWLNVACVERLCHRSLYACRFGIQRLELVRETEEVVQAIGVYLPFVANGVRGVCSCCFFRSKSNAGRHHTRERREPLWGRWIVVQVVRQNCRRVAAMARSPALAVKVLKVINKKKYHIERTGWVMDGWSALRASSLYIRVNRPTVGMIKIKDENFVMV